jgi:hypothetical protein
MNSESLFAEREFYFPNSRQKPRISGNEFYQIPGFQGLQAPGKLQAAPAAGSSKYDEGFNPRHTDEAACNRDFISMLTHRHKTGEHP